MQLPEDTNEIIDWNDKVIEVCYNVETGLFATLHPNQNIVLENQSAGQSPELKRKFSKPCEDPNYGEDAILTNRNWSLGHYCEFQSIESAQAIAWSIFGLVSHASPVAKYNWMLDFFKCMDLDDTSAEDAQFFFWRNLPSAEKPADLCPECDVMIATQNTITVVLCNWNDSSSESKSNFVRERIQKIDAFLLDEQKYNLIKTRKLNLLLVDQNSDIQMEALKSQLSHNLLTTTWQTLCAIKSHPKYNEIQRYYDWKCKHSNPRFLAGGKVA